MWFYLLFVLMANLSDGNGLRAPIGEPHFEESLIPPLLAPQTKAGRFGGWGGQQPVPPTSALACSQ